MVMSSPESNNKEEVDSSDVTVQLDSTSSPSSDQSDAEREETKPKKVHSKHSKSQEKIVKDLTNHEIK